MMWMRMMSIIMIRIEGMLMIFGTLSRICNGWRRGSNEK